MSCFFSGWQLAVTYSLQPKDLVVYWETYLLNRQHPNNYPLNTENVVKFISFVQTEEERKQQQQQRRLPNNRERVPIFTKDTLHLLTSYYETSPLVDVPDPNEFLVCSVLSTFIAHNLSIFGTF